MAREGPIRTVEKQIGMAVNQISLNPSLVVRVLAAVTFLLALASIGGQLMVYLTRHDTVYGLVRLFNVNNEQNVPSFFSSFLLLVAGFLLALITLLKRKEAAANATYWAMLSIGFLYMAVDEAASIHELLNSPLRRLLSGVNLGAFSFPWVFCGMLVVVVLALVFARFLAHLPARTRLTFLIAGAIYLLGAIGFELIGGRYLTFRHGVPDLTLSVLETIEESLEMAGSIILVRGLLEYLVANYGEMRFRFEQGQGELSSGDR